MLAAVSDPLVVAHRGGAGTCPENTLDAFVRAHRTGCVLETDVRRSADGVAVLFHDETLERIGGSRCRVADLDLADLRRRLRDAGHPLVTAEELLHALPDARVVLDVKDPRVVEPLAAVLRGHRGIGRVCATGCWDRGLARLRRAVGPGLALGLGWGAMAALATGAAGVVRRGDAQWAFLPTRLATARTIDRAHRLGLRVGVWTVDEPALAQRFVALGADAVTTDRPDRLLPVLHPAAALAAVPVASQVGARPTAAPREADPCTS